MGRYARRMLDTQPALKALGHAVKKHGTGLVTLIRLCPFPFSYANFFFASIGEVSAGQFFIATCGLGIKGTPSVFVFRCLLMLLPFSAPTCLYWYSALSV